MNKILKILVFIVSVIGIIAVASQLIIHFFIKDRVAKDVESAVRKAVGEEFDYTVNVGLEGFMLHPSLVLSDMVVFKTLESGIDTVVAVKSVNMNVSLRSILKNDGYEVKSVSMDKGYAKIVFKDHSILKLADIEMNIKGNMLIPDNPFDVELSVSEASLLRDTLVYFERVKIISESTLSLNAKEKRYAVLESRSMFNDLPVNVAGTTVKTVDGNMLKFSITMKDVLAESLLSCLPSASDRLRMANISNVSGICGLTVSVDGLYNRDKGLLPDRIVEVDAHNMKCNMTAGRDTVCVAVDGSFQIDGNGLSVRYNISGINVDAVAAEHVNGIVEVRGGSLAVDADMKIFGGDVQIKSTINRLEDARFAMQSTIDADKIVFYEAVDGVPVMQRLLPLSEAVKGKADLLFDFSCRLNADRKIMVNTIRGKGKIHSDEIVLDDSKVLGDIKHILQLNDSYSNVFKNINIDFTVSGGRMYVKPFDLQTGNLKMNISGNHGIDNTLDYLVKAEMPRSDLGSPVNSLIDNINSVAKSLGFSFSMPENMKADIKITGDIRKPVITPVFSR